MVQYGGGDGTSSIDGAGARGGGVVAGPGLPEGWI